MGKIDIISMENLPGVAALEKRLGVSRRDFLKLCSGIAATLGLPATAAAEIAQAVASPAKRPSVI